MDVTRSYVIRIYRQAPDGFAGVLEAVETGETYAFRSALELCNHLASPPALRRPTHSNSNDKERGS